MSDEAWVWTEDDWLSCADPDRMLRGIDILVEQTGVSISERKWTLFMVACLRRIQTLFRDERSRQLVEAIERHADGLMSREQVDQVASQTVNPPNPDDLSQVPKEQLAEDDLLLSYAWDALAGACPPIQGHDFPWDVISVVFSASQASSQPEEEGRVQANLLRDIIGNPFHPVSLGCTTLVPELAKLAQAAYEERTLPAGTLSASRLAVLADALEEKGCTDSHILSHCREPGVHVRGCWV